MTRTPYYMHWKPGGFLLEVVNLTATYAPYLLLMMYEERSAAGINYCRQVVGTPTSAPRLSEICTSIHPSTVTKTIQE